MKQIWRNLRGCLRRGPGPVIEPVLDPQAVFTQRVLKVFGDAHAHADLLWAVDGNGLVAFAVDVSDTFEWGLAEAENLPPRHLHLLEEAFEDLKVLEAPGRGVQPTSRTRYVGMLYAARVRQRRPMLRAYPQEREVGALLDACGGEEGT